MLLPALTRAKQYAMQEYLPKCHDRRSLRDPPGDYTVVAPVSHRGRAVEPPGGAGFACR